MTIDMTSARARSGLSWIEFELLHRTLRYRTQLPQTQRPMSKPTELILHDWTTSTMQTEI